MARTKSSETPHYELLYIVSNKYTEDEVKPIVEKVRKIIEDNKCKITHSEDWGKRKLAYPIEHFTHGYYNLVEFDGEGESVANIDRVLRMSNEVLRHMVTSAKLKSAEEKRKEQEKLEQAREKAEEKEEEKEVKQEKPKEKKVDLKDLDEKLDKILETDDLL